MVYSQGVTLVWLYIIARRSLLLFNVCVGSVVVVEPPPCVLRASILRAVVGTVPVPVTVSLLTARTGATTLAQNT